MNEIILCEKNEKDLREVPESIKKDIKFHFVSSVNEVLKIALSVDLPQIYIPTVGGSSPMESGTVN